MTVECHLNRDGIASPIGKRWNDTTVGCNRIISSGILNWELYNGVITSLGRSSTGSTAQENPDKIQP